ncbi:MAG: hypothetical protein M1142_03590 [Patescibacteria group bacterium]|nr:hypothetical protein [Patescibacteria group bacterium]
MILFVLLAVLAVSTSYRSSPLNLSAQMTSSPSAVLDTNTKASGLRVVLNSLNKQHVDLAAEAMRDGYDGFGSEAFKASTHTLDNNSVAMANLMGSLYGTDTSNKFLEVWRKHIDSYMNYTLAIKNNDGSERSRAMSDLSNQAEQLASLLSAVNPDIQKDAVKQMMVERAQLMLAVINARAAGDWQASYDMQDAAYNQYIAFADGLAAVIVRQFPEKFQ